MNREELEKQFGLVGIFRYSSSDKEGFLPINLLPDISCGARPLTQSHIRIGLSNNGNVVCRTRNSAETLVYDWVFSYKPTLEIIELLTSYTGEFDYGDEDFYKAYGINKGGSFNPEKVVAETNTTFKIKKVGFISYSKNPDDSQLDISLLPVLKDGIHIKYPYYTTAVPYYELSNGLIILRVTGAFGNISDRIFIKEETYNKYVIAGKELPHFAKEDYYEVYGIEEPQESTNRMNSFEANPDKIFSKLKCVESVNYAKVRDNKHLSLEMLPRLKNSIEVKHPAYSLPIILCDLDEQFVVMRITNPINGNVSDVICVKEVAYLKLDLKYDELRKLVKEKYGIAYGIIMPYSVSKTMNLFDAQLAHEDTKEDKIFVYWLKTGNIGGKAVIVANDEDEAFGILKKRFTRITRDKISDVKEMDFSKGIKFFDDGDYR